MKTILIVILQFFFLNIIFTQNTNRIIDLLYGKYSYQGVRYSSFEKLDFVFKDDLRFKDEFQKYLSYKGTTTTWGYVSLTGLGVTVVSYSILINSDYSISDGVQLIMLGLTGLCVLTLSGVIYLVRKGSQSRKRTELIQDFNTGLGTTYKYNHMENYITFGIHSNGIGLCFHF